MEFQCEQDRHLHLENRFGCESILADVDEVFNSGRVNFLILRSDQKSRNAQQLNVLFRQRVDREEAINQIDGDEESFGQQFELHVNVQDPVN